MALLRRKALQAAAQGEGSAAAGVVQAVLTLSLHSLPAGLVEGRGHAIRLYIPLRSEFLRQIELVPPIHMTQAAF